MSENIDSFLRKKVSRAKELAAHEAAAQQDAIAREKGATLGRLELLGQNEDLKWFLATYAKPLVDAAQRDALDVKGKSATERNDAAQQHYLGDKLLRLLESETDKARNTIIAGQNKS